MRKGTRRSRLEDLFWRASEAPAGERSRLLEEECRGDPGLRKEVESLLAAGERSSSPLDRPVMRLGPERFASSLDVAGDGPLDAPPRLGPYRVLRTLGEGGMGVVYLAEDDRGTGPVAVKSILAGMNTREVLSRFEAERRALALMDHPNIAGVIDAGAGEDGRPYFVMEYVEGKPLTEHCDLRRLDLSARLELFIQVCQAIEHAHAHGIIHRDVKPSNILVAERDGRPVVKVIDFGVAKATDQRLTERTLYTALGRAVGTPAYMSPEQTRPSAEEVDHRTDVYSLGVLLYEVLVGEPPFDSLGDAAEEEIFRLIRRVDPPPPSVRWSRLSPQRTRLLAESRREAPAQVAVRLRGPLDHIVMKAMEKEPDRRYARAADLAHDLARAARGEKVLAGPPGLLYRMRRFVGKNRGPVFAAASVASVLVLGLAASLLLYRSSMKNAELADERLRQVLRLGDRKILDDLGAEAERRLWPVSSEMAPLLAAWLTKGRLLAGRLESHQRALASLRDADLPAGGPGFEWWRETMQDLVERTRKFRDGTIPDVERRLRTAEEVRAASLEGARVEWERTIASIADPASCPAYRGLRIAPQEGLVPIGRDPASGLWEFAHLLTGQPPRRDQDRKLLLSDDMALVLVLLPGGRFSMGSRLPTPELPEGSPNVEPGMDDYTRCLSGPVHEIELAPFFISKFEMTRGQWAAFTGAPLNGPHPGGAVLPEGPFPLFPVESVNWSDLREQLSRMGLELPTEAQWEYAARGGTTTIWWTGDDLRSIAGAGNFADGSNERKVKLAIGLSYDSWLDDGFSSLAPVGRFRPNAFGLHDTMGNVSEFCREHVLSYSQPAAPGTGERQGDSKPGHVLRGGSWWTHSWFAASARRLQVVEEYRHYQAGVRPARGIR